jgi:MFS family permease
MVAAAAMVGTLPGRSQGLGLITEPLIADLALDRVTYAELNFWSTLIGAAGALGIGRLIDRFGSRTVLTLLAASLGFVVCLMSQVTSLVALAVWLTLTRALGQSALSVVSLAMIGHWFVRRIDTAMAIYSIVMSIGFMIAFPAVGSAVQAWGWRPVWFGVGVALIAGLAPLAWLVVRRNPEASGVRPDGDIDERRPQDVRLKPDATFGQVRGGRLQPAHARSALTNAWRPASAGLNLPGHALTAALATPAFWMFAVGAALYGLVASGIGLFNESILAERGFGPDIYYQSLVVTAMTALAGNFAGGWLATRMPLGRLLAIALGVLTVGLAALPVVTATWHVVLWAAAMGLGGGLVMVLFFSVWPRVFGRRHLGQIQGAAQAMTVLASAIGPLLLAWCVEWTGSYAAMFAILAALIGMVAVGAAIVTLPEPVVVQPGMRAADDSRISG